MHENTSGYITQQTYLDLESKEICTLKPLRIAESFQEFVQWDCGIKLNPACIKYLFGIESVIFIHLQYRIYKDP